MALRTSTEAPARDDPAPRTFFAEVHDAYLEAEESAGGPVTRSYAIAGRSIRLRFAGPALLGCIEPALAHLEARRPLPPDVTICVWDSDSTGVELPPPPWTAGDYGPRNRIRGYDTGRIRAVAQPDVPALSMLDRERRLALFWVPAAGRVPLHERAAPLRTILHWCIESPHAQLVHAGAVGTAGAGVLLVGRGGAGKSTTALACLLSGLTYVGDDYVALTTDPAPAAWSIYSSAKLNADSLERLPELGDTITNPKRPDGEKALVFLKDRYGERLADALPVKAVVLPHVTEAPETRLVPVSRAASLVTLAPGSIFYLPDAGDGAFRTIADFVREVPSFRLEIGRDSTAIPALISSLVQRG